ncbi:hypothetical protein V6L77_25490 [Pannonibacter sp. Pt2-lr]
MDDGHIPQDGPLVLKLDVEGVEIEALRGGVALLMRDVLVIYEEHGSDRSHAVSRYLREECGMRLFGHAGRDFLNSARSVSWTVSRPTGAEVTTSSPHAAASGSTVSKPSQEGRGQRAGPEWQRPQGTERGKGPWRFADLPLNNLKALLSRRKISLGRRR